MRIWFPTIRAGSGSDVYVERLVAGLCARSIDARLQWFSHGFELAPSLLKHVRPPPGTDIVHANSWNGFVFARDGIPLVVTAFHCVYRCGYPDWKSWVQRLYHDGLIGRYERKSFAKASRVVTMTPSAATDFKARFEIPKMDVIHGWVDTNVFSPGEGPRVEDGRVRLLIVGNKSKRKGMDLLPALRRSLDSRYLITVVGGLRGSPGGSVDGVVYKHGLSLAALVNEYQSADLVVSLSRHEGFGYSALEAMACAKPVVAFDVTGIRDVVADGETGALVRLGSVDDLAAACERLGSRPEEMSQMGQRGRVLSTSKFDATSALVAYVRVYDELLRLFMPSALNGGQVG